MLPSHHGHEKRGTYVVEDMCNRLRISNDFKASAKVVAEFHTHVHKIKELRPETFVKVFERVKNVPMLELVARVATADGAGKIPFHDGTENEALFVAYAKVCSEVKASTVFTGSEISALVTAKKYDVIKQKVARERANRIRMMR